MPSLPASTDERVSPKLVPSLSSTLAQAEKKSTVKLCVSGRDKPDGSSETEARQPIDYQTLDQPVHLLIL